MSITTIEEFLDTLRKSRLLSAEQIAAVRKAADKFDGPKPLARALLKQKLLTKWQAGQLLAGRTAFFLGRYKLIDLLGRGGMGSVFSAEDTKMSRPVALKIISKQLGQDPASLERFFAEARAIAALDHPNIVRAYDVDNASDRYFIVMEFAEGRNLQQVVDAEGPLGCAQAADYIRQAAEGLAHAHGREIVHRDVKPGNLVVNDQGVVKVLDMGMARLVAGQAADGEGEDDGLLGTVDYLAPEQAMRSPDADHRVDFYSLGCTLYCLLTGSPPFPDGSLPQRIIKHQTQTPTPVTELRPDVPPELAAICEKLMAKNADDRFASAEEIVELLADWQPPEEELQAAIPIAEPAAEEGPKEVVKIAEPIFDDQPANQNAVPLGIQIDTGGSSVGGGTKSSIRKREQKPSKANDKPLLADRRVLIGAAVGGTVLVVGIIAGLIFLLSGGEPTDVAEAASDAASPAGEVSESDTGGSANGDGKGTEDVESLPEMDPTSGDLDELEALVGGNSKKQPGGPDMPEEKPAAEPEEPKATAEDSKKSADTAKPTDNPPTTPDEPEKPETESPQKPEEPKPTTEKKPETDTPEKPAEPKPEPSPPSTPPKPVKPVNPLENLKEVVAIPELRDKDQPGEDSRSPLSMGPINAPDSANVQLYLLGGDEAIKGDRKYTLTAEKGTNGSWLIQLDADEGEEVSPVAKVSRAGKTLSFQWADEAESKSSNYLRNCILQVRLDGESKYLQLAEPLIAEPIMLDLASGRSNQTVSMKWLPDTEKLRIAAIAIEAREDCKTLPEEPVQPKTPIGLEFTRTDADGNSSPAVRVSILPTIKRTAINFDVRLVATPAVALFREYAASRYTVQQLGTVGDKIASEKENLAKKQSTAKGREREELFQKIRLREFQLWCLKFYTEIHQKAEVHYRIFIEVDGHEVILATSTTKPIEPVKPTKPIKPPE